MGLGRIGRLMLAAGLLVLANAATLSLRVWLGQGFVEEGGEGEAARLGESLNQPASVDLRVNLLRATREGRRRGTATT